MMVQSTADLKQLKGVGMILGKRLYDAGFDSFSKIAQAGEEGLRKVRGISPRAIGPILAQAKELAALQHQDEGERGEAMQQRVTEVREKIETLAQTTRDRFQNEMTGKGGRKLGSDLSRIEDALVQMHGLGKKRSKRADKALVKAEKRVTGLEDASLKKVRKALKRARKTVLKALG